MAAMTQKERRRLKREKQNPNDRRYIYILIDPRDEAIRYVGQTSQPTERLKWHIADARVSPHCAVRKSAWLNELAAMEMTPTLSVIEECGKEDVSAREKYWISQYELTCDLLNGNLLQRVITVNPSDEMLTALKAYAEKRDITLSAALLELAAPPLGVADPMKKHGGKRERSPKR